MRKTIFTLLLLLICMSEGFAQEDLILSKRAQSTTAELPSVQFRGDIDLGYSHGIDSKSFNKAILRTVVGAQFYDHFSVGLGLGMDFYSKDDKEDNIQIPLFLNGKGIIPIAQDLYGIISLDLGIEDDGFMYAPSAGLQYRNFKFSVGYAGNDVRRSHRPDEKYTMQSSLQFSLGYVILPSPEAYERSTRHRHGPYDLYGPHGPHDRWHRY